MRHNLFLPMTFELVADKAYDFFALFSAKSWLAEIVSSLLGLSKNLGYALIIEALGVISADGVLPSNAFVLYEYRSGDKD